MQFKVPQFIEIEDKIIGPLTLKQFLYLVGGGCMLFVLWLFFGFGLFIIIATPIGILFGLLAFYKFNGRPFVYFLYSLVRYLSKPRLYLWKKDK